MKYAILIFLFFQISFTFIIANNFTIESACANSSNPLHMDVNNDANAHHALAFANGKKNTQHRSFFVNRNTLENKHIVAKEFLDMLILNKQEQSLKGLTNRQSLVKVSALVAKGNYQLALTTFMVYFFDKLEHPQHYGIPYEYTHLPNNKSDTIAMAAANALMVGKLVFENKLLDIGEPGSFNPEIVHSATVNLDVKSGLTSECKDPWKPALFQPLVYAFKSTKNRKYLNKWIDYMDDWAMNNKFPESQNPLAISDQSNRGVDVPIEILQALGEISTLLSNDMESIPYVSIARIMTRTIKAYPALTWSYHWSNTENWTAHNAGRLLILGEIIDEFKVGAKYSREGKRRFEVYEAVQNLPDGTETEHAYWYNCGYISYVDEILNFASAKPQKPFTPSAIWTESIYNAEWQMRALESKQLRMNYIEREIMPNGQLPIGVRNDKRIQWNTPMLDKVRKAVPVTTENITARIYSKILNNGELGDPGFTSNAFPWGGYYNLRSSWNSDAQFADLFCSTAPTAGHGLIGMKNNNTFSLAAFGQDLILTGSFGPYSYHRSPLRVDSLEEFFHAGIANPGAGMDHKGFMTCFEPQKPAPFRWHTSPQFDMAEGIYTGAYGFWYDDHHDIQDKSAEKDAMAAKSTINDVRHQRTVQFIKQFGLWILTDYISSTQTHDFAQDLRLPLMPAKTDQTLAFSVNDINIDEKNNVISTQKNGTPNISIYHFGPLTTSCTNSSIKYDTKIEDGSWLKNDFTYRYKLTNFLRLTTNWRGKGEQQLITLLYPRKNEFDNLLKVESLVNAKGLVNGFRAMTKTGVIVSYLSTVNGNDTLCLDGIRLTGSSLLIEKDLDGTIYGLVLNAKKMSFRGLDLKNITSDFEFEIRNEKFNIISNINRPIDPVLIEPSQNCFVDSLKISLSCPTQEVDIRYTLDNTEVTLQSPIFTEPFYIFKSGSLRVRAFRKGISKLSESESGTDASAKQSATFQKNQLLPPDNTRKVRNGLKYQLFYDDWRNLVFFQDELKPVNTGIVNDIFTLPTVKNNQPYALLYTGYINVPVDGIYTIYSPSEWNLPSISAGYDLQLYIGNERTGTTNLPIEQWSKTGKLNQWYPATTKFAFGKWSIGLKKGLHPFRMYYVDFRCNQMDKYNHPDLRNNYMWDGIVPDLQISGPGVEKQPIPALWLLN